MAIWCGPIAEEVQHGSPVLPTFVASIACIQTGTPAPQTNSTTGASGGAQSIDTTGATLLVAFVRSVDSSTTPTIIDSESNTWVYLEQYGPAGHSPQACIAYVVNPTTSATHSFTATSEDGSAEVYAFSGTGSWSVDKQSGTNTTQSGTTPSTDTITPANANEVVIAGFSSNQAVVSGTVNNGFSGGISGDATDVALCQQLNTNPETGGTGYLFSTGSSVDATFTFSSGNTDWIWAMACFVLEA
jgi:hypothetical protein